MSIGGCLEKMVLNPDDERRRKRVEDASARLGHQIGAWVVIPNEFRLDVGTHVGTCQNQGCVCTGMVELGPTGWLLGGGYLTGQNCPITE